MSQFCDSLIFVIKIIYQPVRELVVVFTFSCFMTTYMKNAYKLNDIMKISSVFNINILYNINILNKNLAKKLNFWLVVRFQAQEKLSGLRTAKKRFLLYIFLISDV